MYRINLKTGEVLVPYLFEDGTYGAADPNLGKSRHHIANRLIVGNIDELREFLLKGWPIWMSILGTRDRRLISKGIIDADLAQADRRFPVAQISENAAAQPVANILEEKSVLSAPVAWTTETAPNREIDYLKIIASMSSAEIAAETDSPRKLLMGTHVHKSRRLDIAYAPFDHVNAEADILIVGITPGKRQMREAIEEAHRAMMIGLSDTEVLARAKVYASFAGSMRTNLVKLMDAVGLNILLNIASTASLWNVDNRRVHFTSVLRYPTFVDGRNYSRSPDINGVPFLLDRSRNGLQKELSRFPNAVIVPMGDMVSEVLVRVGKEMSISDNRILAGMPHASGANNGPISKFLGSAGEDDELRRRYVDVRAKVKGLSDGARNAPILSAR